MADNLKYCSGCQKWLPFSDFAKDAARKDGLEYRCRDCRKAKSKKYYDANKEEAAEYGKRWRDLHPDYMPSYNKQHWNDHERTDRDRENSRASYYRHRDERLAAAKKWRAEHQDQARANSKIARIKRRVVIASIPHDKITVESLFKRDRGVCALCGGLCDYEDYTVVGDTFIAGNNYPSIDHIKPISRGGSHTWDNVQLAHRVCNSRKSNKV